MSKFNLVDKPQTQGQTVGLGLRPVLRAQYKAESALNSKAYGKILSPTWSSSVADPSHSPIERGQRHGPLRREKKVRIRNKINNNRIDRINKKIRINTKTGNKTNEQLKGPICIIQLKDTMTRNINPYRRGVDG